MPRRLSCRDRSPRRRRGRGRTASSPCPTPSPSSAWPVSRSSSGCCSARTTRPRRPSLLGRPRRHRLGRRLRGPALAPGVDPGQGPRPHRGPGPRGHGGDLGHRGPGPCRCGSVCSRWSREVLVSAAVLLLAALGAQRIDVLWVGKAGTFGLMFAYPTFLLAHGHAGVATPHRDRGVAQRLVPALTLAWIAAAAYIPLSRRALARGRAEIAWRRGRVARSDPVLA